MLTAIHPKLPMRNKAITEAYYVGNLGFKRTSVVEYPDYLMLAKDGVEIHFFTFSELDPAQNYGQVYIRTTDIKAWYQHLLDKGVAIHPNGSLQMKPWGQEEFSLLDPDNNLLTFGATFS